MGLLLRSRVLSAQMFVSESGGDVLPNQVNFKTRAHGPSIRAISALFLLGRPGGTGACPLEKDDSLAKFWLEPVRMERSRGFSRADIARIERLIEGNANLLMEAWHEYFAD
jgi:hypothetical protein